MRTNEQIKKEIRTINITLSGIFVLGVYILFTIVDAYFDDSYKIFSIVALMICAFVARVLYEVRLEEQFLLDDRIKNSKIKKVIT